MQKQTAPGCLADKKQLYLQLASQLTGLIRGVPHQTANLANASALLMESLDDVNWVGFYLMEEGRLVLGPFQGRPACIEIPSGRGVCGTAVEKDEILLVEMSILSLGISPVTALLIQRSFCPFMPVDGLWVCWTLTVPALPGLMKRPGRADLSGPDFGRSFLIAIAYL